MKIRMGIVVFFVLGSVHVDCVEAKCYIWQKCWREKARKDIEKAAEQAGHKIEKAGKQIGHEIEKAGGVIAKVGTKIGNVTVKGISKAGDVTIDIVGKAGSEVLKTGQAVVTSTGMTLVNAGGMIVALSSGDLENFKACANAASASSLYGLSTVMDETLKAVGNIDKLIQIESVSFEASSAELAFQGKTPKVSIKGSFLGKHFDVKEAQLDLSNPAEFVAELLELLIIKLR